MERYGICPKCGRRCTPEWFEWIEKLVYRCACTYRWEERPNDAPLLPTAEDVRGILGRDDAKDGEPA